MPALKRHPFVRAELQSAYDWYEDQLPGLGSEFREEFFHVCRKLGQGLLLHAVRFANVRRLNLDCFPYGNFYVVRPDEVCVLAVLHASRDTDYILAERRRTFSAASF